MNQFELKKNKIIDEITVLSKKLGRRPVKRDDERLYQNARRYFGSWNNTLQEACFEVKYKQSAQVPNIQKKELYYFLGLLITDGHIVYNKGKNYQIKLYTSYKDEKEMIIRLINSLFDYKASIRKRKTGFSNKLNYEIFVSSKGLCEFIMTFSKIPSGAKSVNVKIPSLLLESNEEKIGSFLRGVIDGDGTILKNYVVKIVSGSKNFLHGIKEVLDRLKIKSGKICEERETLYVLWICGKDNLKNLRNILYKNHNNFFYDRKKELWNQYI